MQSRNMRVLRSLLLASMALIAVFGMVVCDTVNALDNGLARVPYMGWNTWSTDDIAGLLDLCFEREIHQVADAMSTYLKPLGYEYVVLDDCWAAHQRDNATGQLYGDPSRFPSGMKALADYVHSKGLKLGLYTCAGTQTCKFNRPGSFGHYEIDAKTFADWGVDMVKMDNCHVPGGYDHRVLFTEMSHAMNATGRVMLFELCQWGQEEVWTWGSQVGNGWRIHGDLMPWWYGSQGIRAVIDSAVNKSQYAGPGGWNYLDMMQILVLMSGYIDSKTQFSIWSLVNSPLIVASDVREVAWNPEMQKIIMNSDVIAVNQDPLAKAGDRVALNSDGTEVWMKELSGNRRAVVLFNPHDVLPKTVQVSWNQIGFPADQKLMFYDVWTHDFLGVMSGPTYEHLIYPHDVLMFIAEIPPQSFLVSNIEEK